jgi:hypothetical protein
MVLGRDLDAAFLAIVVTTIYDGASGILRDRIAGPRRPGWAGPARWMSRP